MKKMIKIFLILAVLVSCTDKTDQISNPKILKELAFLHENQDFFKLKKTYDENNKELSKSHFLYYSAIVNKVFNKAEVSNGEINKIISNDKINLEDTLMNKLYWAKLQNHINLYEYEEAAITSDYIQNNFQSINDSAEIATLKNEIKIWNSLKDVPKQEIIKNEDCTIPMMKDKVGLFNIDVKFGDSIKNIIFDTGANFSVIIKSLVDDLGLKYIDADFYVTAATGLKVKSGVAIAEELSLSGITFKNVVFLVLDDKDLSFPQYDYYPNGILGFPVIEAMDEIRIKQGNQIFVPQNPIEYTYNNFALKGLMPVIAGEYKGDTLRFNFDTGATTTSLYPLFFREYRQEIENNYEKEIFRTGSGGGTVEFEGYIISDFQLKIADSKANLDSLKLHIDNIGDSETFGHGNFGQDYISQFNEMIISFKHSSVLFK